MKFANIRLTILILAAPGFAGAADREVDCRLIPLVRGGGLPEVFHIDAGDGRSPKAVDPATGIESDPVTVGVSGDGELRFVGEGRGGETVGVAKVPDGVGDVLVFIVPDANPDDEILFTCMAVDAAPAGLSRGGAVFCNAGGSEAQITLGGDLRALPAGSVLPLGAPAAEGDSNQVPMKVEVKVDERWRPVKDGSTRFSGDVVYWVVLFEQAKVKRPQIRIFKQR